MYVNPKEVRPDTLELASVLETSEWRKILG
jgi:hypothetical protein